MQLQSKRSNVWAYEGGAGGNKSPWHLVQKIYILLCNEINTKKVLEHLSLSQFFLFKVMQFNALRNENTEQINNWG